MKPPVGLHLYRQPLFEPESKWIPPTIESLPDWANFKRVGIDCETFDPYLKTLGISVRRGGYMVGISFSDGEKAWYLPIRHGGGGNLPVDEVLAYLRDNCARFKGEIVGANFQYDLDYLNQDGIFFPHVKYVRDIQIAAPLIYELHPSYSLKAIGERYGIESKNETKLFDAAAAWDVDPKSGMWKLPSKYVGEYAETDAIAPMQILERQEAEINKKGLKDIWDLESRLPQILVKMRQRGVRVDMDQIDRIDEKCKKKEKESLKIILNLTGCNISGDDLFKVSALAPALRKIGAVITKTPKGKDTVKNEILAQIGHPVADAMLEARTLNKLRTTFVHSIREYQVRDRIHCTFNQMARDDDAGGVQGARFGRMSCTHPNLQQQPVRTEIGQLLRTAYLPEDEMQWASMDYSQQEPRWTAHFAAAIGLKSGEKMAKKYTENPDMDNHDMMTRLIYGGSVSKMTPSTYKKRRNESKQIFLGICYGIGSGKMAKSLGLPTERQTLYGRSVEVAGKECQQILDKFNERVPYVKQLAYQTKQTAKNRGWIRTKGGRVLNFPKDLNWDYKSLNRLIQGTSADQTKKAIINVHDQMPDFFMQLAVHDEITASVRNKDEAAQAANIMANSMPSEHVPFRVDVELGDNWGNIK